MDGYKVLHIVGGMDRGGVETWLMHVLRNINRDRYRMDFLVHTIEPCAYDDEMRDLGSRIIPCPGPQRPFAYARRLRSILREYGPYDVVHSHVHHYSGWTLRQAAACGVPVRIAHSHTGGMKQNTWRRMTYETFTKRLLRKYATHGIGISESAASSLFGDRWASNGRIRIIYYGFDFTRFGTIQDRKTHKTQLRIPHSRFVIGHIGRFASVKNHSFIVDVFSQLVGRGVDAQLLLVGDGPLYDTIQQRTNHAGLEARVTFAGNQEDIAPFLGAMDLFVFPSLYEGLGIVVLESQAAGTPSLISSTVPYEVDVIPGLVTRLSVNDGVLKWADTVESILNQKWNQVEDPYQMMAESTFGISRCIQDLTDIYSSTGE